MNYPNTIPNIKNVIFVTDVTVTLLRINAALIIVKDYIRKKSNNKDYLSKSMWVDG